MSNEAITKAVEAAKAALFECYEEMHRLECTYVQTATWDVFVETPAMTKAGEALEALSALQPSPVTARCSKPPLSSPVITSERRHE